MSMKADMDDIDDKEEEDADGKRGITYQVNFAFGWEFAVKRARVATLINSHPDFTLGFTEA